MKKPTLVSSLAMSFRRAVTVSEDHEEVKKEHRQHLKELVEDYKDRVASGEAEGIRHAKDLIEIMKMDLLLMGEATERTEQLGGLDEIKVVKATQAIDENDPAVQKLMSDILGALNNANDDADDSPTRRPNADEAEHMDALVNQMQSDMDEE
jgi:hypothetical protein